MLEDIWRENIGEILESKRILVESTHSESCAGSSYFNYKSSICLAIFGMLHVRWGGGGGGRQEGCLGGRLRQVAGKLATVRSRWVVVAYTPYITRLPHMFTC